MTDAAEPLRRRLSEDLLLAMKAKDAVAVAALRSVMSALDNASAVPASAALALAPGRNADVPRRDLSNEECRRIVGDEANTRAASAAEYARLGQDGAAARLRAEQAVVERYVESVAPSPTGTGVRPETPTDRAAVRAVNEAAFGGRAEADLVEALHARNLPLVSLVAEVDGT